jgi:tetratricopeptide (TPR) repeat protein
LEKAVVWNRLGNAYRKLNDYIKAIQAHRKALELDPKNISARQDLIRIHNDLGHIKAAIDLLTASLDKASAWNMLGNAYRRLSDYESATEAFQKAVDLAPNDYAFKFDLEESIKVPRHKFQPSTEAGEEDMEEIKIALRDAPETSYVDENQPGPLGELIDIQIDLQSDAVNQPAKVIKLLDLDQEIKSNYPIGEPARRVAEVISARRSLIGLPAPAYLSSGGEGFTAVVNQNAPAIYHNMWHLDETLSSFQKVTESTPVESLDPALLVYHHAVELVSVGSGRESFVNELKTFSPLPAGLADTAPTIVNPRVRKPLEFMVAEPAPVFEHPEQEIPSEALPQEASAAPAPTITRAPAPPQNKDTAKLERDIITYKTVTGINPKNSRAWHSLGNLQRSAGQFDEAAESLEKAVELDPRQEVFHYHLGLVYAAQNRFEEAVETFKKVISINPGYNLAHATLAGYYGKLGKTKESQYHMTIARRTMQDEKEYNQACFEAICGNTEKAIELLKIALKENQTTLDWVRRDPDFDNIRSDDRFRALTAG